MNSIIELFLLVYLLATIVVMIIGLVLMLTLIFIPGCATKKVSQMKIHNNHSA
ncbi:MAG: hypothetical protein WBN96_00355 [Gammaproteobacteria bacterium]